MARIKKWAVLFVLAVLCLIGVTKEAPAQPINHHMPTWWELMAKASQPIDVSGEIVAFSFPVATIKTLKDEYFIVRLGPWWFWRENKYKLNKKDNVRIVGFRYNDLIFPKVIKTSHGEIRLRDEQGRPLWRINRRRHHRPGDYLNYYHPRWR